MVHIRWRIGRKVTETTWEAPHDVSLNDTEDFITSTIREEYSLMSFHLEYLGCLAWDVIVDGEKVGHAKAWDDRFPLQSPDNRPLFPKIKSDFADDGCTS